MIKNRNQLSAELQMQKERGERGIDWFYNQLSWDIDIAYRVDRLFVGHVLCRSH